MHAHTVVHLVRPLLQNSTGQIATMPHNRAKKLGLTTKMCIQIQQSARENY